MSDLTIALCGFALDGHISMLANALTRRGRDGRYFYGYKSLDHVPAFFVRQTYVPIFNLIHRQAEAVDPVDWLLGTVRMQNNAAFLQGLFDWQRQHVMDLVHALLRGLVVDAGDSG